MGNFLCNKDKFKKTIPAIVNYDTNSKNPSSSITANNNSYSIHQEKKITHTNNSQHNLDLYVSVDKSSMNSKSILFLTTLAKNGGKHTFKIFDDDCDEEHPQQKFTSYNFNILKTDSETDELVQESCLKKLKRKICN